jgi:hypothetical protein
VPLYRNSGFNLAFHETVVVMERSEVIPLFSCGSLVLTIAAWVGLSWVRAHQRPRLAIVALSIVTANATFATGTYVYYRLHPPSPSLPPWKDPQILNFGLLILLAPIGMIVGGIAATCGTSKWLTLVLELASIPLLVLGFFTGAAV